MSVQITNSPYEKTKEVENQLSDLYSLKSTQPSDFRNKYRLLSPNSMYLVASHFYKSDCETIWWCCATKWRIFKLFDKTLQNEQVTQKNMPKIMASIDHAIQDQRNITFLKRLNAVLLDKGKGPQEKTDAFRYIERENSLLFDQIKYCILVANEENPDAGLDFPDRIINCEPDAPLQKAVIKQMIKVLKDGYSDCKRNPGFFRNLFP